MPLKPCIDCGTITNGTRCAACSSKKSKARDAERGTRHERGYDADYEAAKRDPAFVAATHCARCRRPFTPANRKTAGHKLALRKDRTSKAIEPQCEDCNYGWRRTGA